MKERHKNILTRIILPIASAFLMIVFFIPQRGAGGRGAIAGQTVATVYGSEAITGAEQQGLLNEWEIVRHRLYVKATENQQAQYLAAGILGRDFGAIDANPKAFVLLKLEAQHLGVAVSNDELQDVMKNVVGGMPDESDENYDGYVQSVEDLLQVKNLLNSVGSMVKISQPRGRWELAQMEQDLSISLVQIPINSFLASAPTPTDQDVQLQYDRYSNTIAGQTAPGNTGAVISPLGFGYRLPNRAAVQYIGVTHSEIIDALKSSPPPTGNPYDVWDSLAERLYREHWKDYVPKATAPPDWSALTPSIQQQVYASLYDSFAGDLTRKVFDRITGQMASDWQQYHDAVLGGQTAPMTSYGVAFNTNDYLRLLAAGIQKDFGVRVVLGIDENGLKGPLELAQLPAIGDAHDAANNLFPLIATTLGDQFQSASSVSDSDKLTTWQPSPTLFTGTEQNPDGLFIFRITAMDPSHTAPLAEARPQVERDVRTQFAWDAATKQADGLQHTALTGDGLLAAAPFTTITTDYFNAAEVGMGEAPIPGLNLKPESMRQLAGAALRLLSAPAAETKPITEVELPADHELALVELEGTRANWVDTSDELMRQAALAQQTQNLEAQQLEAQWAQFDAVSKRTDYQEVQKD